MEAVVFYQRGQAATSNISLNEINGSVSGESWTRFFSHVGLILGLLI